MSTLKKIMGLNEWRYSAYQFSLFRIIFGIYLIWHFGLLIPFASELFSGQGQIPRPELLPTSSIFPNLLSLSTDPWLPTVFISFLFILSVMFTVGLYRPIISLLLWFGWATLFNRNIFISNPGLPMVGWVLLACSLVPRGEPFSLKFNSDSNLLEKNSEWKMPALLFWGAWLIIGVGYTLSGVHKMSSPSWANGTAIRILLDNPLARDTFIRDFLITLPDFVFKIKTYFSLGLEVLFLPLVLFHWTRLVAWVGIVGMHLGILSLVSFADLTLGVLMMHLFTFDSRWIPGKKAQDQVVLYFDGVCGLCNSTVDFVLAEDHENKIKFSPLQSDYAKKNLPQQLTENLQSLVVQIDGKIYTKSSAVILLSQHLGGIWRLAVIGHLLPTKLSDLMYDYVARNRYKWFGQKETCRLPTPTEKLRFILS